MEPEEVANKYKMQAEVLKNLILFLDKKEMTKEELIALLKIIAQSYMELLLNLAQYTPELKKYSVLFFPINQKLNLEQPPFEKDFFNSEH